METTIITAIMSSLTTIIVAILGVFQAKKAKETTEYNKLQEELAAEREKTRLKKQEEDEKRLLTIENTVTEMRKDVKNLEEQFSKLTTADLSSITEQLSHLHILQTDNFEYIQSLSNVVLTIGETLNDSDVIDSDSRGKMATSITEHRIIEDKLHKKLYNIIL